MQLSDLQQELARSLKTGDVVRVETLRFLIAAVNNAAIAKYGSEADSKLTEEDILEVVKKQVKTHKESIEAFAKAGRSELADREKAQLAILEAYLPKQLSDEELRKLLEPIVTSTETNFGILMKQAMEKVAGKANGGRVAGMLKKLSNGR